MSALPHRRPGRRPTRYAAGRWVTIGGREGDDGRKHGGSPVYVEDGRITKGHPGLTGKKLDALKEAPEAIGGHRSQLHQSAQHERAAILKDARKAGVDK